MTQPPIPPEKAPTSARWPYVVLGTGVLVLGVVLYIRMHPPVAPKGGDCRQLSYKVTQGYSATIKPHIDVAVGVQEQLVREYEDIQKDFALKYETICRDFENHAISSEVYNCRREQADKALDYQRQLGTLLNRSGTAPSAGDSANQYITQIVEHLHQTLAAECKRVSLEVVPDTVRLTIPEGGRNYLTVRNVGPSRMNWFTKAFPDDKFYMDNMDGGALDPDGAIRANIVATPLSLPGDFGFWVRSNTGDSARVGLHVRRVGVAAGLPQDSLSRVLALSGPQAVAAAVRIVDSGGDTPETVKLAAATDMLFRWGKFGAAKLALDSLAVIDPSASKARWYTAASTQATAAHNTGVIVGPIVPRTTGWAPYSRVDSVVVTELTTGSSEKAVIRDGWYSVTGLPTGTYKADLWTRAPGDTAPVSIPMVSWDAAARRHFTVNRGATRYALLSNEVTPK